MSNWKPVGKDDEGIPRCDPTPERKPSPELMKAFAVLLKPEPCVREERKSVGTKMALMLALVVLLTACQEAAMRYVVVAATPGVGEAVLGLAILWLLIQAIPYILIGLAILVVVGCIWVIIKKLGENSP